MSNNPSRREFLVTGALAAAGITAAGGLTSCATLTSGVPAAAAPMGAPSLRIAHLTDTHVKPENRIPDQTTQALLHALAQNPKPDLIINGGDAIMDALAATRERTLAQWNDWKRAFVEPAGSTPILHTIGNHDIWGWNKDKSGTTGNEAEWGKRWACEMYGRDTRWQSHDAGGWHIIVLDSTQPASEDLSYTPFIDEEQFEWLAGDLAAVPPATPVLIVSHIPILSVCHLMFSTSDDRIKYLRTNKVLMHHDGRRLSALFEKHPNVKCCASGHIHLVDECHYKGVTYYCNGAVSGNWWGGPFHNIAPGYAILDLYPDGRVERQYVEWGWVKLG